MSKEVVFVCTAAGCDAGPWEGAHDAMAHCAEHTGHGYTGRPRSVAETPIPASDTYPRDTRNLQHKGDPRGALAPDVGYRPAADD